jgi:hypothetical protein
MGVKRINARGLAAANKIVILAAACYNMKKLLKFTAPKTNIRTMAMLKTKAGKGFGHAKKVFLQTHYKTKWGIQFFCLWQMHFLKQKKKR